MGCWSPTFPTSPDKQEAPVANADVPDVLRSGFWVWKMQDVFNFWAQKLHNFGNFWVHHSDACFVFLKVKVKFKFYLKIVQL